LVETTIRLTVLGGSGVATPELMRALTARPDRPAIEITLHGRTREKLGRVAAVCERLAAGASPPLTVRHMTDLAQALEGADYVLNQIRVGGYAARRYDETFPQAFGIPGEETFGPGGMNNARRTIPVTLESCRVVERVAPEALLINLTNPSSFIQYAVSQYTKVHVVGVCDSPVGLARAIAAALGAPPRELWVGYVGMHHFGWVTEVRWRGRDVLPDVLANVEKVPGLPVDPEIVRAVGAIPTSYFKYYYHADRMLDRQKGRPSRAEELLDLERRILADYEKPGPDRVPKSLEARGAHWYEEIVVPVLLAHAADAREVFVLNVPNGATLPWMPKEAIIEVPVVVAGHGLIPLEPPAAPPDLQAMLRRNAACEMLWVEAVVEGSEEKALRAMALNPLVHSLDQARAILKEIWGR
jgi:6-phospho-beta-glucosidase